jgi:hypothetical protein
MKKYNKRQLKLGIKIEREHTSDDDEAELIAKDHLDEIPDYYDRLINMEKKAMKKSLADDLEKFDSEKIKGNLQKLFLGDFHGYKVYSVNGNYVKMNCDMDFTEGGNGLRYKFISNEKEIWIDNNKDVGNYKNILGHEFKEILGMKKGKKYEDAHNKANRFEKKLRKRDAKLVIKKGE